MGEMRKMRREGGKEYKIWQLMVRKHFTDSQQQSAVKWRRQRWRMKGIKR